MSNTYNCIYIYIYAKKLNNKTGCAKVNISFVQLFLGPNFVNQN